MESLGQLKTKSRNGYPKFTAVREAAAEANACTSAEIERSFHGVHASFRRESSHRVEAVFL